MPLILVSSNCSLFGVWWLTVSSKAKFMSKKWSTFVYPVKVRTCLYFLSAIDTFKLPTTPTSSLYLCHKQTGHCDCSAINRRWRAFSDLTKLKQSFIFVQLYNMYYTREYIIWFLFYLLWHWGLSLCASSLFEKPSCQYVVEEKESYICSKICFGLLIVNVTACILHITLTLITSVPWWRSKHNRRFSFLRKDVKLIALCDGVQSQTFVYRTMVILTTFL